MYAYRKAWQRFKVSAYVALLIVPHSPSLLYLTKLVVYFISWCWEKLSVTTFEKEIHKIP